MLFNNIYGNMLLLYMRAHKLPKILVPKEICFSETFLLMSKYNNSVFNHLLFKSIPRRITLIIITINFVAIEFCYRIDFTDLGIFQCHFSLHCAVLLLPPTMFCGNTTYLCKELLLNFWSDRAFRVHHDTISNLKLILYFFTRNSMCSFFFFFFCNPLPLSNPRLITSSPFTYLAYASIRLNP